MNHQINLDQRKACRPFGDNIGMVMGESAQFVILMDENLALELGAKIYASVQAIASHADGFKKVHKWTWSRQLHYLG